MKDGVDLNVRKSLVTIATTLTAGLLFAAPALAHLERPSYWPDPGPDSSVKPAAGGEVPKARSLSSAVSEKGPGEVRVVCKGDSLDAARASIRSARTKGFRLRPSQPEERLSAKKAKALLKANRTFGQALRVRLGPGGGDRLRQQRPDRHHARPLHRARVAKGADERPEVQSLPPAGGPERRADSQLRVPGDLPERPEPDLRAGARRQGQPAAEPASQPPWDPDPGARRLPALQPADRRVRRRSRRT